MYQLQIPGKLFLLGEYAILEPGSLALIAAFDAHLNAKLHRSDNFEVRSALWPAPLSFSYSPQGLQFQNIPPQSNFVRTALEVGFNYLECQGISPQAFRLHFESMDPQSKRGLGSSAAVTVGILSALFLIHGLSIQTEADKLRLFKLAVLAHTSAQGGGSGGDLAAIIFGQVVAYTSYDFVWLQKQTSPLDKLIAQDWPYLKIEKLTWPLNWPILVGWTRKPAKTPDFIQEFHYFKTENESAFQQFLFISNANTAAAKAALLEKNWTQFQSCISQARRILLELASHFAYPLETPELSQLIALAENLGMVAKFSGAGGGDCGLAWGDQFDALSTVWEQAGITPLKNQIGLGLRWESTN